MSQPKTTNPSDQELVVVHRRELSELSGETAQRWWVLALLGLGILAILHVPIFWMRQEKPTSAIEESQGELFAIVTGTEKGKSSAESSLWQWIHMVEPSQWYYPTTDGFSRLNQRKAIPGPILRGYVQPTNTLPPLEFPSSHLEATLPPMNGQDFLTLPVFIAETPIPGNLEPDPQPPRWRRIGGNTLAESPKFTAEELSLLQDPEIQATLTQTCLPTTLEVNFRPGMPLPRILIRESCGVHELDMAALRAMRKALYLRGVSDLPCEKDLVFFYSVDWRM